jgi:hypothetical protein
VTSYGVVVERKLRLRVGIVVEATDVADARRQAKLLADDVLFGKGIAPLDVEEDVVELGGPDDARWTERWGPREAAERGMVPDAEALSTASPNIDT